MKVAAISKTSRGVETVVAVFQAPTRDGIQDIANRWLSCSGRLADLHDDDTPATAQQKLEQNQL